MAQQRTNRTKRAVSHRSKVKRATAKRKRTLSMKRKRRSKRAPK